MTQREAVQRAVEDTRRRLKQFQQATVDEVYARLFVDGRPRMLVADEVGLGKTLVARGVLARLLERRLELGETAPLRVTYICSNQIIGIENVRKLDLFPGQPSLERSVTRLAYLALEPPESPTCPLRLTSLTPGTSFRSVGHTGDQEERRILYALLMSHPVLAELPQGLAALLRGTVRRDPNLWAAQLEERRRGHYAQRLRVGLAERFLKQLENLEIEPTSEMKRRLGPQASGSLLDVVFETAYRLQSAASAYEDCARVAHQLIRQLRRELASACVDYLEADLFILDEFQRFRDLIDEASESDASAIARRIFGRRDARILLLSATPFKAFTGSGEVEEGDEHYREFKTVLSFLLQGDRRLLDEYDRHRQALFKQMLSLRPETGEIDATHRRFVEGVLRTVMCRTERLSVSQQRDAMTWDRWHEGPVNLTPAEVASFLATDRVVRALNGTISRTAQQLHSPVEFCKSAPCPLSFLDDYQLKRLLKDRRGVPTVREVLVESGAAWLQHERIDTYGAVVGSPDGSAAHARLALLAEEALAGGAELMLWVPPSLEYYPLAGAFAHGQGFTKTLVFSGWLMVPRMIASLLSYEVERRTIGNPASNDIHQREPRRYFVPEGGRRHPSPQLVFRVGADHEAASMSNFALLYPSLTLASLFDPMEALAAKRSRSEIETQIAERCRELAKERGLERFQQEGGEPERWYWAAPLLLDREHATHRWVAEAWLGSPAAFPQLEIEEEETARRLHLRQLRETFRDPQSIGLGSFPPDLFEVLASIAVSSPAVAILRSLRCHFGGDDRRHLPLALSAADRFLNLFNKPEAVAAVRIAVSERLAYWQKVLRYCGDGCLQAVLDEYFHLLRHDCDAAPDLVNRLNDSVTLKTSSINVDDLDTFLRGERKKMRCHFAVDLGNQRVDSEEGSRRITSIRQNFNSPFRPFVLATTSIGQEGLDFHLYCRKVVHWNLPSNPIDLEQREGRVNRYKAHVIRRQVALKYGPYLLVDERHSTDIWEDLFRIAALLEGEERAGELIPYWHVETNEFSDCRIERIIPYYPYSRDHAKLLRHLRTLAIYRLAFGQPRQSELIEHLLENVPPEVLDRVRSALLIDLSPINYRPSRGT